MTYAAHTISVVATANLRFLCCCLELSTQLGIPTYSFNFQPASSGAPVQNEVVSFFSVTWHLGSLRTCIEQLRIPPARRFGGGQKLIFELMG